MSLLSDNIIVFSGPSIAHQDVEAILDCALCFPPVRCGDLLSAARLKPKAIAIIDGYFYEQASVWHKEILWVMGQGIPVYGAASMGALRAAELCDFGMKGVGRIFEDFYDGRLTGDDEVALLHDEQYTPHTIALVNLRYDLEEQCAKKNVSPALSRALINATQALAFLDRKPAQILRLMRDSELKAQAKKYLKAGVKDFKREDAILLLKTLAKGDIEQSRKTQKPVMTQAMTTLSLLSATQGLSIKHPAMPAEFHISYWAKEHVLEAEKAWQYLARAWLILSNVNDGRANEADELLQAIEHFKASSKHYLVHQSLVDECEGLLKKAPLSKLQPLYLVYTQQLFPKAQPFVQTHLAQAWSSLVRLVDRKGFLIAPGKLEAFSTRFRYERSLIYQDDLNHFLNAGGLSLEDYPGFIRAVYIFDWIIVRLNADMIATRSKNHPWWYLFLMLISAGSS